MRTMLRLQNTLTGQLEEFTPEIVSRFGNVRLLAKYLLQRGWLSVYQMNQLFQGRLGARLQFLEKLSRIEVLKGRRRPL